MKVLWHSLLQEVAVFQLLVRVVYLTHFTDYVKLPRSRGMKIEVLFGNY